MEYLIGLGTNLGEREVMLERACREICSKLGRIRARSSLYETKALLHPDNPMPQPNYLNGAIALLSDFEPMVVLENLC